MINISCYQKNAFSIVAAIMMMSVVLLAGGARAEDTSIPIHVDIFIDNKTITLDNSGNFFVTILSTNGFNATNATTGVNFSSVRFQGVAPFNTDNSDKVNLKLHFHSGSEIQCGNDRTVYLIGTTIDGRKIVGWVNNVAIVGCKYSPNYQPPGAPKITSFSPPTPVTNNVGVPITFSITVNQTVDVIWYFNGTLIQLNASVPEVTESSYTYISPSPDKWNVTAVANNANGTDRQIWEWIANKADQIITFGPLDNKTYGDPDFTVSATTSSGLPVSFAASGTCTVSGRNVHITGAGSCTITANQPGNASYNVAPNVSQTFDIAKRPVTITAGNKLKAYGAALPALTVSYTGLVNGDTAPATLPAVTTTATASSPVGTYTITASGAADTNYTISYTPGTLTVTAVALTLKADDKSKAYGTALPALTVSYTGLVNGDTAPATLPTVTTTATASSPVGTYPITASGAADPNYTISYTPGTLTVTAVALTLKADEESKVYGEPDPVLTYAITSGTLITGDSFSGNLSRVPSENVGTYAINQGTLALNSNYVLNYIGADLTITELIQTSTALSFKSSDSGCGRNVYAREDPSNIKQHEFSREVDVHISKGINEFKFETLGILNEVGFTPSTNEGCTTALGQLLKSRPSQATSDVAYPLIAYFNAWVGPLGYSESAKIKDPFVVFNVSENSKPVQLMMYRNGTWIDLKTEKIGEGRYKAYVQGFGSFAIVEIPETPSITPASMQAITNDHVPQNPVNWILIIIIIAAIISIAVIYHRYSKGELRSHKI